MRRERRILVVDVGGSNVKCAVTGREGRVKFRSGPRMTPARMMKGVRKITKGWSYDAVSIGYPGVVADGKIVRDPHNLAKGWIGYDFRRAFRRPVKILNDAAMQAYGGYTGGKMLFLGLGTGLGSTLIVEGKVLPLELGHLRYSGTQIFEDRVGEAARERIGNKRWRSRVWEVVEQFRNALLPDYVLLGGGNVAHLEKLPPRTKIGGNADAVKGGFRMWEAGRTGTK
jgi:polyphosphate glucokinase